MQTTTQTPPKANNPFFDNGFPNLVNVPDVLHDFLLHLRKHKGVKVKYQQTAKQIHILIYYTQPTTITGIELIDWFLVEADTKTKSIVDQYKLTKFRHHDNEDAEILLTKRQ